MYGFRKKLSRLIIGIILAFNILVLPPGTVYGEQETPEPVNIGVLAKRGTDRCLRKWGPTAYYLTNQVPGYGFMIVPLSYDDIYTAVERKEVDFILANSSFYVGLESLHGVSRIVTLKNLYLGKAYTVFGGAIFWRADHKDIKNLHDLKGKSFMAVEERSFGGWRIGWRELKRHGIDPHRDFADLSFGGTHDAVVYAVLDGRVDAGTVRTDTLERMAMEGNIRLDDFRVFPHKEGGKDPFDFPLLHSTDVYPEWPLAALEHTSDELAEKVAAALLRMSPDSPAAKAARCAGWTIPHNYQSVHDCLKELRVEPYKDYGRVTLAGVIRQYWPWIVAIIALVISMAVAVLFTSVLNRRLKSAQKVLKEEVTERKAAEEKLRETHDYLENLLNCANAPIIVWDPEFRITRFNHAFERLTGKSADEVVGRPLDILFPDEAQEDAMDHIHRATMGERWEAVEIPILRTDGAIRTVLWNSATLYATDSTTPVATIAQGVDITERKRSEEALRESEEYLRQLIEQSPLGIMTLSPDGTVTSVNQSYLNILGGDLTSDEIVDKYNLQTFEVFRKAGLGDSIDALFREGRTLDEFAWIDGFGNRRFYAHYRAAPICKSDGAITGYLWTASDETDRKLAQEMKSELETQLRQAQKMEAIGTLAGGIAHDFNNILHAIIGYTEIALQDVGEGSSVQSTLSHVMSAGGRAKDLVKQILAFSRQATHERRPIQINLIVKEALKLLRASIPSTINIRQNIDSECGAVMADPTQIHQVIMNLCTNAYHAMQEQGGTMEVSIKPINVDAEHAGKSLQLEKGKYILMTVSDTGHGMDHATLKRIFDPFFTTKKAGEGTGLGLSTVHGIITSYGGAINVYSEPGKGTTFNVYLPRIAEATQAEVVPETETIPTGSEHILVVDDEDTLVKLQTQMLEHLGYEVTPRTSSIEALEAFRVRSGDFDLVITDQTMPNMTGLELARELVKIRPDIPVVLTTGFSETISQENAKEMGINEFLMKPVLISDIANAVRRVLDSRTHS